jgi:hypothetical protein
MSKTRRNIIIVLLILLIATFIPFDMTMSPSRDLNIVDESGSPVQNAIVRQIWNQYSLGISGEEDFKTDSKGMVMLPKRSVSSTIFRIIIGAIKNVKKTGIHASFSTSEDVAILADGFKIRWFYDGRGLESSVIKLSHGTD